MRSFRGVGLAVSAAAIVTIAGCTSQSATTPTFSADLTTSASQSATNSPSSSRASDTTSASSTATSSSSTAAPSSVQTSAATTGPWPRELSPAQVEDAKAAITAYVGYYDLVNRAYADPSADWSTEVKQWAAGSVADRFLANISGTAELGQYRTGTIVVEPEVTQVQTALVDLDACVDATAMGFFDRNGVSIKAPDAPGSYFRHPSKIQVGQFEGGQWLVQSITDDYTVTC